MFLRRSRYAAARNMLLHSIPAITPPSAARIPPVIYGISPTHGTALGGTPVLIQVDNSNGITGASVGGAPLTSFSIVDRFHVAGVTAAHASGAADVTVTRSDGQSGTDPGAYTYDAAGYDPSVLPLTNWHRDYTGTAPWAGSASAGASGSRTLVAGAFGAPTAGPLLNGHGTALFDGATEYFSSATVEFPDTFGLTAGSIAILYNATAAAPASPGAPYNDAALFSLSSAGNVILAINSTGPRAAIYDNVSYKEVQLTAGLGAWHLVQMRWDGTNLEARLDGGAWVPTPAGSAAEGGYAIQAGTNYAQGAFYNGLIADWMTLAAAIGDADSDNLRTYVDVQYALSL